MNPVNPDKSALNHIHTNQGNTANIQHRQATSPTNTSASAAQSIALDTAPTQAAAAARASSPEHLQASRDNFINTLIQLSKNDELLKQNQTTEQFIDELVELDKIDQVLTGQSLQHSASAPTLSGLAPPPRLATIQDLNPEQATARQSISQQPLKKPRLHISQSTPNLPSHATPATNTTLPAGKPMGPPPNLPTPEQAEQFRTKTKSVRFDTNNTPQNNSDLDKKPPAKGPGRGFL